MRMSVSQILRDYFKSEITIYATGLKAKGILYLMDLDLRIIGIKQSNNKKLLIDIKSINAIELGDEQ